MSHCRKRCKRQLTKVARYFYRFLTGTLTQGRLDSVSEKLLERVQAHLLLLCLITMCSVCI